MGKKRNKQRQGNNRRRTKETITKIHPRENNRMPIRIGRHIENKQPISQEPATNKTEHAKTLCYKQMFMMKTSSRTERQFQQFNENASKTIRETNRQTANATNDLNSHA